MKKTTEKHTLKHYPDSEKPYEKCVSQGPEYLTDAELLAVILRTGTRDKSAVDVAREFLMRGNKNLLNIHHLSLRQMQEIPGIGGVKAVQLKCIGELAKRLTQTDVRQNLIFDTAEKIADYYMEQLRHETREQLVLLMLDMKCKFLADRVLSIGTVSASLVSSREIFLTALENRAVNIVLLHNHPSGDPKPSTCDVEVTKQVEKSGLLLGITLIDHIIIGDNNYVSFKKNGLL